MADNKRRYTDETELTANTIPAELTENDDIVEYIQPSNLDLLKARYAAIDENEEIRNDGFDFAKKGGLIIKQRPESNIYGYFSGPVNPKDEIRTDMDSPLSKVFDATRSEFDANTVTFSDIGFEQEKKDAEIKSTIPPVEVEKPKRKRTTTVTENETQEPTEKPKRKRTTAAAPENTITEEKPTRKRTTKSTADTETNEEKPKTRRTTTAAQTADVVEAPKRTRTTKRTVESPLPEVASKQEPEEKSETPAPVFNNRYGFDTHTRVIYVDESADDGIKRNSDDELSSLFSPENNRKKRRRLPWLQKRK